MQQAEINLEKERKHLTLASELLQESAALSPKLKSSFTFIKMDDEKLSLEEFDEDLLQKYANKFGMRVSRCSNDSLSFNVEMLK